MSDNFLRNTSALVGGFAILCGAFGAHALKQMISVESLSVWQTAVQYQMYHGLALFILGLWERTHSGAKASAYCWLLGVGLFSGSLYALALGAPRLLGAVTPVGGLFLCAGWICLFRLRRYSSVSNV